MTPLIGALELASHVALWVLMVGVLIALFALYRYMGETFLQTTANRSAQGPEVGDRVPVARLPGIEDGVTHEFPPVGRPSIAVFVSTTCGPCEKLKPDLLTFAAQQDQLDLFTVCSGTLSEVKSWTESLASLGVTVFGDPDGALMKRYGVDGTPVAIGIDAGGRMRGGWAVNRLSGLQELADLMEESVRA